MPTANKTVSASVDNIREVQSWICDMLGFAGFEEEPCQNVLVASEEVFVNIASYAYPAGEGFVTISFTQTDNGVLLEFTDGGVPFDPLSHPDPDITAKAEDRPIGGLGVFLVKKLMDDVSYRHEDGKNILTMRKVLP